MMNQCLLAQATAFYGIHNRENRILRDGMRQYGRGLSMLRNTLGEDHCTVTTEIIVSAFALSVVEVRTLLPWDCYRAVWFPN